MEELLTIYDPKIIRDIDFMAKDSFTQKKAFLGTGACPAQSCGSAYQKYPCGAKRK